MPRLRIGRVLMMAAWAAAAGSSTWAQVMRAPGYYLPPAKPATSGGAAARTARPWGSGSNLLDLNAATPEQLRALPGMGAEYARRVIAARPYRAKNQLVTRGVLPAAEYARIRELVVAHRVTADAQSSAMAKR